MTLPLGNVHLWASAPGKVVINVVETTGPGLQTLVFHFDDFDAKATPKAGVTVVTDKALFKLGVDVSVLHDVVVLRQMCPELFTAMASFATYAIQAGGIGRFVTFP